MISRSTDNEELLTRGFAASTLLSLARFRPSLGFLLVANVLGQLFAAGLTIPLLVRLGLDLPLHQKLGEFSTLRFTFERHRKSNRGNISCRPPQNQNALTPEDQRVCDV